MNQPNAHAALEAAIAWFERLIELSPDERMLRLNQLRVTDADLALRVEQLLAADAREHGLLEVGLAAIAPGALRHAARETDEPAAAHCAGEVVGQWRLLDILGSGGMGEVWRAQRHDGQYEQQVALKLLKRGMDSDGVLRRFRSERQILARLEHPGIARLIDGGMTAQGLPYLVMECIAGSSITQYANTHNLDARGRARLVIDLCTAVDFAHRRLVIHRDLKPGNVLVADDGSLKVLDFGIAKVLEETGDTNATETSARVMSPAYAAPEQLLGEPVAIAADIYAIGLILFELLSGVLPHGRGHHEWAKVSTEIARDATQRPSAARAQHFANRATGLAFNIDAELDLIVLQALRLEPERRYRSAAEFAEDLQAWLEQRPIRARPTSVGYRLQKFIGRNRVSVSLVSLALVGLLCSVAVAFWQAHIARAQTVRAVNEAESGKRITSFALSMLRELNPHGRATSAPQSPQQLIARSIDRARIELSDDDEARATVLAKLGEIQGLTGDLVGAESAVQEALQIYMRIRDVAHPDIASTQMDLATIRMQQAKFIEAEQLLIPALAVFATHSNYQTNAAQAQGRLAAIARSTGRPELALQRLDDAIVLADRAYGPSNPNTIELKGNRAMLLATAGRFDEAERNYRSVIAAYEQTHGKDFPRLLTPLAGLGAVLGRRGNYQQARDAYDRGLAIGFEKMGRSDPVVVANTMEYAKLLSNTGDIDQAEARLRGIDEHNLSGRPTELRRLAQTRATLLRARRQYDSEKLELEASLRLTRQIGTEPSIAEAALFGYMAMNAIELGDWSAAESATTAAEAMFKKLPDAQMLDRIVLLEVKSTLLAHNLRNDEAAALLRETIAALTTLTGADTVEIARLEFRLANVLAHSTPDHKGEALEAANAAYARLERCAITPTWRVDLEALQRTLEVLR
jgi:eukaryotic-like serine/threonine-protein kinase